MPRLASRHDGSTGGAAAPVATAADFATAKVAAASIATAADLATAHVVAASIATAAGLATPHVVAADSAPATGLDSAGDVFSSAYFVSADAGAEHTARIYIAARGDAAKPGPTGRPARGG